MAIVADEFFGRPTAELEVVGVTGTNGKTTTAFLLFAILAAAGRRPGLLGTIEARVGGERRGVVHTTPEAIDLQRTFREMLDAGDRSCAMEASSHASVQHRLDRVRFSVLIFTNLTQDHLDFHGTMDAYFEAKRRLFAGGVRAAINVGDEYGRRLAAELPEALTFGEGGELGPDGLAGIDLKLRGRFNVTNALGARAAARLLGIDDDAITRGLESVRGVPGRFESIEEGQPFSVIVDYAHTADALANVLRTARDLGDGRLICVFGAGGDRDRDKRPQMGRVVSELADLAIVTSDNPRSEDPHAIIEAILAGASGDVEVEPDRAAAIARAVEIAHAGDVVVIAGKGHEQGQQFADRTLPFDDRDAARDALRKART
jgi:UDP-N-acetylmuramoyl-L-alanyl-D-glutamate--2,6-diaminopimelate ligase